jgi:hypothetical protein
MRVIVRSDRDRIAAEQRRRHQVEADYRQAQRQHAAGERELLAFAKRLGPEELAIIDRLNAQGGWPLVAQALQDGGLSAGAISVATTTVEQGGGLNGLRTAVVARLQQERQETAASELASFGRIASAQDVARITDLYQRGGPEAVAQALVSEAGLSRDAAEVALQTIRVGGLEGLRRGVEARVQHETAAQAKAAQEEARAAEAQRAAEAPPPEAQPEKKPADPMAAELLKRAGERDAQARKDHPGTKPPEDPKAASRKAMSDAYDRLATKRPRLSTDIHTGETVEVPKGAERFTVDGSRKAALVAGYAKISGESVEMDVTGEGERDVLRAETRRAESDEADAKSRTGVLGRAYEILDKTSSTPEPEASEDEGRDRRAALSAAYDRLSGGGDE